jgi:hypothetical protein
MNMDSTAFLSTSSTGKMIPPPPLESPDIFRRFWLTSNWHSATCHGGVGVNPDHEEIKREEQLKKKSPEKLCMNCQRAAGFLIKMTASERTASFNY